MKTFSINTLGCKVNQYESQQVRQFLEQLGLTLVATPNDSADLIIINTCCVTGTAAAKSRNYIRKAKKLNPDAIVIVTGCLTATELNEYTPIENTFLIQHRHELAATLSQIVNDKRFKSNFANAAKLIDTDIKHEIDAKIKNKDLPYLPELPELTEFKGQTRIS